MFKPSEFTECYVIEMHWVGNMDEATLRVKVTQKNVYKKYLENLVCRCTIRDYKTGVVCSYHENNIKGDHNEHARFIYCEDFVNAYRVINYYKTRALGVISMVGYVKQNAELGFDNLTIVNYGNEKITIDDYLN